MTLRLLDNGIFITIITSAVLLLGVAGEFWSQELASQPYRVRIELREGQITQLAAEMFDSNQQNESSDEMALIRSAAHQAIMSNPEFTADDETLYQLLQTLLIEESQSPALLNDLAVTAIRVKRFAEAADYLERGLVIYPDYTRAYFNLGLTYTRLNKISEAEEAYKTALNLNPGYQSAALNLGVLYLNADDFDNAEVYFERAASISSGDNKARALRLLGTTLLRSDRPELAVTRMRKAIEYNPRDPEIWLGLGIALTEIDGMEQEAIQNLQNAIALDEKYSRAHYRLGDVYGKIGLWKESIAAYLNAVRWEPTHVLARKKLAALFEESGDMAAAKPHYRWLAENVTDVSEATLFRAIVSEQEGRTGESIAILAATLEQEGPVHAGLLKNLGLLLRRTDRTSEALEVYKIYMNTFPLEADAYVGAAAAAIQANQRELAARYLDEGIKASTNDPNIWFMRARLFQFSDDKEQALDSYERCLVIDPEYRSCALNLAVLKGEQGDDLRVVELYQKILVRYPTYVPAMFNLALAYNRLGREQETTELYEQILDLEPDNSSARINLALIRKKQGFRDLSEALLRDGLAIDPSAVAARYNLALLLGEVGNNSEKITELQRVTRLQPDYERAWRSLALTLTEHGRYKDAVHAWIETIELDPEGSLRSAFDLGEKLYTDASSAQDRDLALTLYSKMYEARSQSAVLPRKVAELLLQREAFESAESVLSSALEKHPQHKLLWRLYALALAGMEDYARAIDELMQLMRTHAESARDWRLIGHWRMELMQFTEARAAYQNALAINPESRAAQRAIEKIDNLEVEQGVYYE